jgi:hypothetical protein
VSVDIDAGFEVAPGEASDVEVANVHACWYLIISDARRLAALARVQFGVYLECSAAGRMSTGGV